MNNKENVAEDRGEQAVYIGFGAYIQTAALRPFSSENPIYGAEASCGGEAAVILRRVVKLNRAGKRANENA
jgi:hypothetical protein